jgi:ribonuclease P protein component
VYEQGRRVTSASFVMFGMTNGLQHCRMGLTVTRKIGGAVSRNRIKRRLRELFRHHWPELSPPIDIVINARTTLLERAPHLLEREFLDSFRQLAAKVAR